MKLNAKAILIIVVGLLICASAGFAKPKVRKLGAGTYIKSAKIEILSGDTLRYLGAEALLDSLFMHYGPVAEGLFLMNQMMVDYLGHASDLDVKRKYIERMVAYNDSLHLCCENEKIKKKYRKDCDEYIATSDSTSMINWGLFYNAGVEQLTKLRTAVDEMAAATDSVQIAFFERQRDALADSCMANMQIALILNPEDYRGYVGVSSVFIEEKQMDSANYWLLKGLDYAQDRENGLLQISYNYINNQKYCEAIPTLKEYCELVENDTLNWMNLGVCYSRCGQHDLADKANRKVLELDPSNLDGLITVGSFFNQQARDANDSASYYRDQKNDAKSAEWLGVRKVILDSSLTYFRRAFEAHPDSLVAAENYGLIAFVQGYYDEAITAYSKVVEIDPTYVDAWTSLGDAHIQLHEFAEAIVPYEKVLELEDDNADIVERLVDLYRSEKMDKKAAAAEKRLAELRK